MKIKNNTRLLVNLNTGSWLFLTEDEIKKRLELNDLKFKWHYMSHEPINNHLILNIDRKAILELIEKSK